MTNIFLIHGGHGEHLVDPRRHAAGRGEQQGRFGFSLCSWAAFRLFVALYEGKTLFRQASTGPSLSTGTSRGKLRGSAAVGMMEEIDSFA